MLHIESHDASEILVALPGNPFSGHQGYINNDYRMTLRLRTRSTILAAQSLLPRLLAFELLDHFRGAISSVVSSLSAYECIGLFLNLLIIRINDLTSFIG